MTKFILDGGRPVNSEIERSAFIAEILRDLKEPIRLLECFFAKPNSEWEALLYKDKERFSVAHPNRDITFELATEESFIEQVRNADVIYLHGGTTKRLLSALQEQSGWEKELDGKTVVGSSAGANVLARYYYGLHSLQVEDGLGVLAIKVISHFNSDYNAPNINWQKAYDQMQAHGQDVKLIALGEGQFEVYKL